jgi:voltage-gated potassium channel Kch
MGFREESMRFEYFSFMTITTLGYGDITPITDKATALALIEAVVGQVYMVVLVAWLVGMHVSQRPR